MAVTVLVTGATGALGRHIVAAAREHGAHVYACDRVAPGVDCTWDVARAAAPAPNIQVDTVIHAAGQRGSYPGEWSAAQSLFDVNFSGTLRVLDWCRRTKARRLVLISGALVYGVWTDAPKSEVDAVQPWLAGPYAMSKWCAEEAIRLAGDLEVCILRLSSLYSADYPDGLLQRLLRRAVEGQAISLVPPFDDAFDLLHTSDAARTVVSAALHMTAGLWNVGGGRLWRLDEIAELCSQLTGVPVRKDGSAPVRAARILNWVDDSRARRELQHVSTVSLQLGLAEIAKGLGIQTDRKP